MADTYGDDQNRGCASPVSSLLSDLLLFWSEDRDMTSKTFDLIVLHKPRICPYETVGSPTQIVCSACLCLVNLSSKGILVPMRSFVLFPTPNAALLVFWLDWFVCRLFLQMAEVHHQMARQCAAL